MESTTLYYFFSTVAQVLAAISALLAVFVQFKISEIKKFLIGDGAATFERMKNIEVGYYFAKPAEHKTFSDRLRDAVGRESIKGIEEVIEVLANKEMDEGKTIVTNPRGLQYLQIRYSNRMDQLTKIKSLTKKALVFAFGSIFISINSIVLTEKLVQFDWIKFGIIILVILGACLTMFYTLRGVYYGLKMIEDV